MKALLISLGVIAKFDNIWGTFLCFQGLCLRSRYRMWLLKFKIYLV